MKKIYNNDKVKEEIDLFLSLLDDVDNNTKDTIERFHKCTKLINDGDSQSIINLLNKYYYDGLLTSLSLRPNDFEPVQGGISVHSRYQHLIMLNNGEIIYKKAYEPYITHVYNKDTNCEEEYFPTYIDLNLKNRPIYITKGGVCMGDCLIEAHLKQSTIEKNDYTPHTPIKIPCSLIISKDEIVLSVDCREPKLRAVRDFYDTKEINVGYKFDIRKFKKLNKK